MYVYVYIKWTVFVNVTTKSAQHAHARTFDIIVEKVQTQSHLYDHGFLDVIPIVRQSVNHKKICVCMAYDFNSIIL